MLGDTRYGEPRPVGGAPRLMLHAWRFAVETEGMRLDLVAKPPEDFLAEVARRPG